MIKWFQKELEMPLNDATKTAQQLLDLRFFHVPTKDALITSYPSTFNETLFYRFYVCIFKTLNIYQSTHFFFFLVSFIEILTAWDRRG